MHKHFRFQIKSLSADGSFEGLAAVYGNVDLGGDVIEPGAFNKTLAEKNFEVPILWQHDMQIDAEILAVRIAVDFDSFVELRGQSEDLCPISAQTKAKVVDAPSGMAKYVDGRVTKGGKIAFRLILLSSQSRMKTSQHQVQPL